ncbi:hypothetical protein CC1G_02584 [Coprinopsis cinerea okayama7|uniref:Uncharacterized protein n=1 Tax=Coprinopsis cinerea (strain Okayama-7 / 130 / ATCC MYA-4618 / FGSC 9003) TaxID=240176 RepID=A8PB84_COPC7|nr:hypothetical protein CC1G_02584 [Coprinopsis cinerea okayama7\|eukprot:XP_001840121.2 hypothetical protein CC1G_02584 [Coprinopsis cinerea okayama7\
MDAHSSDDSLSAVVNSSRSRTKSCKTCKQVPVPAWSSRVNCINCREKNRKKQQLVKARKELRFMQALAGVSSDAYSRSSDTEDGSATPTGRTTPTPKSISAPVRPKENRDPRRFSLDARLRAVQKQRAMDAAPVQKRPPKRLKELEGDERQVALKMMKARIREVVDQRSYLAQSPGLPTFQGTEFQNASALYRALNQAVIDANSSSSLLRFRGYHSIIKTNDCDHLSRLDMVIRDIRGLTGVRFQREQQIPTTSTTTKSIKSFLCTCKGFKSTVSQTALAPPKKTSNLLKWARGVRKEQTSSEKVRIECHGVVSVIVESDNSHPCGIPGQRIIVSIEHTTPTQRLR